MQLEIAVMLIVNCNRACTIGAFITGELNVFAPWTVTKLPSKNFKWFNSKFHFLFSQTTYDKDITPYVHVFIYHAHYFAEKYGCLKAFEMEAVEQWNYIHKLVFFGASNHGKENFSCY